MFIGINDALARRAKGNQAMEFREMRTAEHGQAVEELDQESAKSCAARS